MTTPAQSEKNLLERYRAGDPRALARLLTLAENGSPLAAPALEAVWPLLGGAYRIGLTGAPGAGKSTLVNNLVQRIMAQGHSLAVLAVDPSSPISGGAVLGDRIRFTPPPPQEGQKPAFFRSAAARGNQGGLAKATEEMSVLLEGFGYERLLIESVGVGQVGLDIAAACDTTVVVVVPESGDDIQALKAGLLEMADLLVVNKADRPGAQTLVHELREAGRMRTQRHEGGWLPPVLLTNGLNGDGCQEVLDQVALHHAHQMKSGGETGLRRRRLRQVVLNLLRESVQEALGECVAAGRLPDGRALEPLLEAIVSGASTPFAQVRQTVQTLFSHLPKNGDGTP